jgi:hypothetical protein
MKTKKILGTFIAILISVAFLSAQTAGTAKTTKSKTTTEVKACCKDSKTCAKDSKTCSKTGKACDKKTPAKK